MPEDEAMHAGDGMLLERHTAWIWRVGAEPDAREPARGVGGGLGDTGTVIWLTPDPPRDLLRMVRQRAGTGEADEQDASLAMLSETVERAMIRKALASSSGDVKRAATGLGTTSHHLHKRMSELDISLHEMDQDA